MVRKGKATNQGARGRSGRDSWKPDCPESEEVKALELRRKELKRRLRKMADPLERRRLEQEIKVLEWHLQRLRVRPRTTHS